MLLRHDFMSALATKELVINPDNPLKLDEQNGGYKKLIQYTDSRLKVLNLIRLGFDPTPIVDLRGRIDSIAGTGVSNKTEKSPSLPQTPTPSPKP